MIPKDTRRGERRWRSHCVWIRRLRNDWATHGWNWNYARYPKTWLSPQVACSFWAGTTLCACFYDPSFNGMGRFKDTPTGGHRKRSCNGRDGDRMNEYKAEQRLEVEKETYGTSERLKKRLRLEGRFRRMKVTCLCGYLLGHIMVPYGGSRYSEISRRYGSRHPKCPNCDELNKERNVKTGNVFVSMPA